MSKADEMFEKLGYSKSYDDEYKAIHYGHKRTSDEVVFREKEGKIDITIYNTTMRVLQAINEKCKELGWIA